MYTSWFESIGTDPARNAPPLSAWRLVPLVRLMDVDAHGDLAIRL
jgi:hypothetical protein